MPPRSTAPLCDEPEFVVHNVWRQYGGWYDGNPANLKPATDRALAVEIAALCGGAEVLASRARELSEEGSLRLASHLAQLAGDAEPTNPEIHAARRDVFATRSHAELSLMARAIFGSAARESQAALDALDPTPAPVEDN